MRPFCIYLAAMLFSFIHDVQAQIATPFQIDVEEVQVPNMPGLQSFVHAQHNGQWLLIGGRTDGLHQRQPFASFSATENNTIAYVVDASNSQVWSKSLAGLPTGLFEQLQSTNMQFEQVDSILYLIGGYGYSSTAADHITHDKLAAINVPGLIDAIVNNTAITPYFRQISHTGMAVSGGYLGALNQRFYLAGGQKFTGRYNPHGPNHGPGFVQEYTNAIRSFEIQDNGTSITITNFVEWIDTANLHRRDYNMANQVFPDGSRGFTMFSGVFQYSGDIPWLNTIDIKDTGYSVVPNFNQYLNQYHTAHVPIHDAFNNAMHTIFFGGMSRYTLDAGGNLVDDINVPFVKTISQVSRYHDGSLLEYKIGDMSAYLGSGAEFIPLHEAYIDELGMVLLDSLSNQKTLIGYLVGGIESSQSNIFFINTGTQSHATDRVFKVYITKNAIGNSELMDGDEFFKTHLFPNPAGDHTKLRIDLPHQSKLKVELINTNGKVLSIIYEGSVYSYLDLSIDLSTYSKGVYFIKVSNESFSKTLSLVKE